LLAIHAAFGLDDWTKEQAAKLADAGYVVLALDLYRGKLANTLAEATEILRPIPAARKQQDVLAAMQFLRSQMNVSKDRIGSIGWCMGGTFAFQLATLDPLLKVAVIRYGHVAQDTSLLRKINARILGIFGGKDSSIPVSELLSFEQQMKDLGKPAEILIYPEAGHAFETPEHMHTFGSAYRGYRADDTCDAWKRTVKFLDANLKSNETSEPGKSASDKNEAGKRLNNNQGKQLPRAESRDAAAQVAPEGVLLGLLRSQGNGIHGQHQQHDYSGEAWHVVGRDVHEAAI
jgi:carboxymethylenebutenolidase